MFSSSTLILVLLCALLAAVVLGYLALFLEGQRYQARPNVLHALNRYALICGGSVVALALILMTLRSGVVGSGESLSNVRDQLAALQKDHDALRIQAAADQKSLAAHKGMREQLQQVRLANVTLKERVEALVQDLEDAANSQTMPAVVAMPVAFTGNTPPAHAVPAAEPAPEPVAESEPIASDQTETHFNVDAMLDDLETHRRAFGRSINPDYQTHLTQKQAANVLIQRLLRQLDHYDGAIDGSGPQTQAAVKSFQDAEGLPVTGIIAKRTTQRLKRALERSRATLAAVTLVE